jgi:hypothetical protein
MGKIFISCDGGLGNRLGSLIGGIELAEVLNYEYVILWPQNRWCNCNFEDLYDINNNFININQNHNDFMRDNKISLIISHINNNYPSDIELLWQHDRMKYRYFYKHDNIFYNHNSIPNHVSDDDSSRQLSKIKISPQIIEKVFEFINQTQINSETIGLHIRRTDSPIIASDEQYVNFINGQKDKKIFICSDEKDIEMKLKSHSKNVISRNKIEYVEKYVEGPWRNSNLPDVFNVNRSKQSVIDAFIDMLLLSRTSIVRFNNNGSFYKLAQLYKKVEL